MTYRPHLDGIRAIAVLAVVLFHAHVPGVPGGFVGVDVFFVISGYLITGLLLREIEETGGVSILRFAERRVRRLAPALFVVLLATLIAGIGWLSPIGGEQQGLAKSAIATVLLSANHYFWLHTGGYFDAPNESFPLLHTWTLSVEEQFYLLWPWLLLAASAWSRHRGGAPARIAMSVIVAVFFLSLAACVWVTRNHQAVAFFLMPFRAWEFAAGGAAVLLLRWRRPWGLVAECIALGGLIAVIASIVTLRSDMSFPGWIALFPVLGSAALIYGTEANPQGVTARMLSRRPMVLVGLISYSLYLWHWPILSIAQTISIVELGLAPRVALCLGSVLLAWLTYRYIEQPIRSMRVSLMGSRVRTFQVGATMMASLTIAALGLGIWAKAIWPSLPGNAGRAAGVSAIQKAYLGCMPETELRARRSAERGCLTGQSGPVRILLWGDSHAGHLKPVLEALASARGTSALLRWEWACPPALGFNVSQRVTDTENCALFNRDVLADIRARTTIDTVILSARWEQYLERDDRVALMRTALIRTIGTLRAIDLRVVVVAPGPSFSYRVPACLMRKSEQFCGTSRVDAERRRASAMSVIRSVALAFPEVVIVDPFDALCTSDRCMVREGIDVLYFDADHLTIAGAAKLVPTFLAMQKDMLKDKRVAAGVAAK